MNMRLLAIAILPLAILGAGVRRPDAHVLVVVNAANPDRELTRERLSMIFLRQVELWEDGHEILPVDQIDKSAARAVFARDVHGRSISALKRYWQERIFSGNESPPPERVTDSEVLTYVRTNPGAIGYVLEGQELGSGIKVIQVRSDGH
jgi:ABC-type phosphate transport system substrate-binding protein